MPGGPPPPNNMSQTSVAAGRAPMPQQHQHAGSSTRSFTLVQEKTDVVLVLADISSDLWPEEVERLAKVLKLDLVARAAAHKRRVYPVNVWRKDVGLACEILYDKSNAFSERNGSIVIDPVTRTYRPAGSGSGTTSSTTTGGGSSTAAVEVGAGSSGFVPSATTTSSTGAKTAAGTTTQLAQTSASAATSGTTTTSSRISIADLNCPDDCLVAVFIRKAHCLLICALHGTTKSRRGSMRMEACYRNLIAYKEQYGEDALFRRRFTLRFPKPVLEMTAEVFSVGAGESRPGAGAQIQRAPSENLLAGKNDPLVLPGAAGSTTSMSREAGEASMSREMERLGNANAKPFAKKIHVKNYELLVRTTAAAAQQPATADALQTQASATRLAKQRAVLALKLLAPRPSVDQDELKKYQSIDKGAEHLDPMMEPSDGASQIPGQTHQHRERCESMDEGHPCSCEGKKLPPGLQITPALAPSNSTTPVIGGVTFASLLEYWLGGRSKCRLKPMPRSLMSLSASASSTSISTAGSGEREQQPGHGFDEQPGHGFVYLLDVDLHEPFDDDLHAVLNPCSQLQENYASAAGLTTYLPRTGSSSSSMSAQLDQQDQDQMMGNLDPDQDDPGMIVEGVQAGESGSSSSWPYMYFDHTLPVKHPVRRTAIEVRGVRSADGRSFEVENAPPYFCDCGWSKKGQQPGRPLGDTDNQKTQTTKLKQSFVTAEDLLKAEVGEAERTDELQPKKVKSAKAEASSSCATCAAAAVKDPAEGGHDDMEDVVNEGAGDHHPILGGDHGEAGRDPCGDELFGSDGRFRLENKGRWRLDGRRLEVDGNTGIEWVTYEVSLSLVAKRLRISTLASRGPVGGGNSQKGAAMGKDQIQFQQQGGPHGSTTHGSHSQHLQRGSKMNNQLFRGGPTLLGDRSLPGSSPELAQGQGEVMFRGQQGVVGGKKGGGFSTKKGKQLQSMALMKGTQPPPGLLGPAAVPPPGLGQPPPLGLGTKGPQQHHGYEPGHYSAAAASSSTSLHPPASASMTTAPYGPIASYHSGQVEHIPPQQHHHFPSEQHFPQQTTTQHHGPHHPPEVEHHQHAPAQPLEGRDYLYRALRQYCIDTKYAEQQAVLYEQHYNAAQGKNAHFNEVWNYITGHYPGCSHCKGGRSGAEVVLGKGNGEEVGAGGPPLSRTGSAASQSLPHHWALYQAYEGLAGQQYNNPEDEVVRAPALPSSSSAYTFPADPEHFPRVAGGVVGGGSIYATGGVIPTSTMAGSGTATTSRPSGGAHPPRRRSPPGLSRTENNGDLATTCPGERAVTSGAQAGASEAGVRAAASEDAAKISPWVSSTPRQAGPAGYSEATSQAGGDHQTHRWRPPIQQTSRGGGGSQTQLQPRVGVLASFSQWREHWREPMPQHVLGGQNDAPFDLPHARWTASKPGLEKRFKTGAKAKDRVYEFRSGSASFSVGGVQVGGGKGSCRSLGVGGVVAADQLPGRDLEDLDRTMRTIKDAKIQRQLVEPQEELLRLRQGPVGGAAASASSTQHDPSRQFLSTEGKSSRSSSSSSVARANKGSTQTSSRKDSKDWRLEPCSASLVAALGAGGARLQAPGDADGSSPPATGPPGREEVVQHLDTERSFVSSAGKKGSLAARQITPASCTTIVEPEPGDTDEDSYCGPGGGLGGMIRSSSPVEKNEAAAAQHLASATQTGTATTPTSSTDENSGSRLRGQRAPCPHQVALLLQQQLSTRRESSKKNLPDVDNNRDTNIIRKTTRVRSRSLPNRGRSGFDPLLNWLQTYLDTHNFRACVWPSKKFFANRVPPPAVVYELTSGFLSWVLRWECHIDAARQAGLPALFGELWRSGLEPVSGVSMQQVARRGAVWLEACKKWESMGGAAAASFHRNRGSKPFGRGSRGSRGGKKWGPRSKEMSKECESCGEDEAENCSNKRKITSDPRELSDDDDDENGVPFYLAHELQKIPTAYYMELDAEQIMATILAADGCGESVAVSWGTATGIVPAVGECERLEANPLAVKLIHCRLRNPSSGGGVPLFRGGAGGVRRSEGNTKASEGALEAQGTITSSNSSSSGSAGVGDKVIKAPGDEQEPELASPSSSAEIRTLNSGQLDPQEEVQQRRRHGEPDLSEMCLPFRKLFEGSDAVERYCDWFLRSRTVYFRPEMVRMLERQEENHRSRRGEGDDDEDEEVTQLVRPAVRARLRDQWEKARFQQRSTAGVPLLSGGEVEREVCLLVDYLGVPYCRVGNELYCLSPVFTGLAKVGFIY